MLWNTGKNERTRTLLQAHRKTGRNAIVGRLNEPTSMAEKRHFAFDNMPLDSVFAHGGSRPILTRRVLEAKMGTAVNFIDFTIVPAGSDIGVHTHSHDNEEIYIIISGQGEMAVDGQRVLVGPGHVIINRPGGSHGLKNTGDTDLYMVVIEIPATPLQQEASSWRSS